MPAQHLNNSHVEIQDQEIIQGIKELKEGESLVVILHVEPGPFVKLIQDSGLGLLMIDLKKTNVGEWTLKVKRKPQSGGGCCGACGGHE